ncbi:hypothetical protein E4U49_005715 [Claviceps purpurea]|nr:hypothetical protein E4U49_005715 [Claviceps purpurea]
MAVVVERDDDEPPWDISTYEKAKDAASKGMDGRITWKTTREAIIQRGILMEVVADMRDSVAALDRNAVALTESHNALAKEGALWRDNDRRQKDMIGKLQLELARAMKQPVRTTRPARTARTPALMRDERRKTCRG